MESTYWWDGRLTTDTEDLLVFKTREALVTPLIERLTMVHPYDVPEVLALPVADGHPDYMRWVGLETANATLPMATADGGA